MPVVELAQRPSPFDASGVTRGADGVRRYDGLASSLVELLRGCAEAHPDREAVAEVGGERWTYGELWERATRIAGGLRARGVVEGDRVAIALPAGTAWVGAFFGSILAGGTVVALNTRLSTVEIDYVLGDCGAAVVLDDVDRLPDGEPYVHEALGHDDVAALFYTSGTTGFPKGAVQTHGNFLSNVETLIRTTALDRERGDELRTLISVPLFHVTGCNSQLLSTLALGGTAVVLPVLNVARLLALIPEERISWLVAVPAIYNLMIRHDDFAQTPVESVRWVGYGGSPTTVEAVRRLAAAFPGAQLSNGYGCTETSSLTSLLPHRFTQSHADSVGLAVPVVDLAVEADHPVEGRSHVGELLVRGPNVIAGYWGNPEATQAAFHAGWFRTGDIVRIDAEGFVYLLDRLKDMIIRGGENVYCVEVENALAEVPGIVESAVCGVPDDVMGEKVGAVVVGREVDPESIVTALRGRIADYKIPQYVVVQTSPLPRSAAGKVRKAALSSGTTWGAPLR